MQTTQSPKVLRFSRLIKAQEISEKIATLRRLFDEDAVGDKITDEDQFGEASDRVSYY